MRLATLVALASVAVSLQMTDVVAGELADPARAGGLADPTRPAMLQRSSSGPATRRAADVRVQAILERAGIRRAIVNDALVKPGDRIGNLTIEAITAGGVLYSRNGRSAFARMTDDPIEVRRPSRRGASAGEAKRR